MKGKTSYQAAPSELFKMRFRRAGDQCQVLFSVGNVCLIAMFWKFGLSTGQKRDSSRSRSLPRSAAGVHPALRAAPPTLSSTRGNCPDWRRYSKPRMKGAEVVWAAGRLQEQSSSETSWVLRTPVLCYLWGLRPLAREGFET